MKFRRAVLAALALLLCYGLLYFVNIERPAYLTQAKTEAMINGKKVSITYGQPGINGPAIGGRDLFSIAPIGFVWRFGRNEATLIETSGKLLVGGTELAPGKYTLWARRLTDDKWVISFHPKTREWYGRPLWGDVTGGAARVQSGFVADMALSGDKTGDSADSLDIKISENKGSAVVTIHFGKIVQTGTFGVM